MDKTNEKLNPHKMWIMAKKATELIALIGSLKEYGLPIPKEIFQSLVEECNNMYQLSEEFFEYAVNRDNE